MVTSPLISLSTQTTAPAAILTLQKKSKTDSEDKREKWVKMLANVAS